MGVSEKITQKTRKPALNLASTRWEQGPGLERERDGDHKG